MQELNPWTMACSLASSLKTQLWVNRNTIFIARIFQPYLGLSTKDTTAVLQAPSNHQYQSKRYYAAGVSSTSYSSRSTYVKKPATATRSSTTSTTAKAASSTPVSSPGSASSLEQEVFTPSTPSTPSDFTASNVKPPTSIGITSTSSQLQFSDAPNLASDLSSSSSTSAVDWSQSYHGLGLRPFSSETGTILTAPLDPEDIEIKPDGLIYLPEIKYRRILNKSFGPGGWGLAPRSETIITPKMVTREYALVCQGRLVAVARGEQDYFDPSGIATATEGCKSNAMMRCCKDLGVASELWDPRFIRTFKKKYCQQVFVEHVTTKKKKSIWIRKDDDISYPFKKC